MSSSGSSVATESLALRDSVLATGTAPLPRREGMTAAAMPPPPPFLLPSRSAPPPPPLGTPKPNSWTSTGIARYVSDSVSISFRKVAMPGGPNTDTEVGGSPTSPGPPPPPPKPPGCACSAPLMTRDADEMQSIPGRPRAPPPNLLVTKKAEMRPWRTGAAATAPGEAGSSETSLTSARCESSPQSKSHEACGVRTATQGEPLVRERASERVREGKKSVSSALV